jgi:esterase/lipase superfamily enzyme
MMVFRFFVILCLIFANTNIMSQINFQHFYMYDKSSDPDDKKYDYGIMEIENKKLIKQKTNMDEDAWMVTIKKNIDSLTSDKNSIIIYIHGYQGDNKYFMQQSGYILQETIFDSTAHSYGMAISLQWTSVIIYDNAVQNAYKKGSNFVATLYEINNYLKVKHPAAKVTFLCHSMGNKVFQGIYEHWIKMDTSLVLENVIMMAADLPADIFKDDFPNLSNHVRKLHIYHHLGDKTLQMANAMKSHQRLGIIGPEPSNPLKNGMFIRNATKVSDDESFAGKLTNHRYYYGSPTIRQEIVDILKN